ncbi:MAG: hypothetical protein WDN08_10665 [Rhizomicrobium sp.]
MAVDRRDDILQREQAAFLGEPRMIDDLEQEIAELVLEAAPVPVRDGAGHLIGFLDGVRRDGVKALGVMPGTAGPGIAQPAHDLDEGGDVGA